MCRENEYNFVHTDILQTGIQMFSDNLIYSVSYNRNFPELENIQIITEYFFDIFLILIGFCIETDDKNVDYILEWEK